jgi:hypothetical protein
VRLATVLEKTAAIARCMDVMFEQLAWFGKNVIRQFSAR